MIFWFLLATCSPGSSQGDPGLAFYLDALAEAHPGPASSYAAAAGYEAEARAAEALPDPQLILAGYAVPVETRVGPQHLRVSVTQPFPNRRKRQFAASALRRRAAQARAAAARELRGLERDLIRAFAGYYGVGREIEIHRDHIEIVEELHAVVAERYRTGAASYNDLLRLEMENERLRDRLASAKARAKPLSTQINALIGRDTQAAVPFPDTLPILNIPPTDPIIDHPMLEELLASEAVATNQLELAKLATRPDWQFGLDWIETGPAEQRNLPGSGDDPLILRVGVNLPVWKAKNTAVSTAAGARVAAAGKRREAVALRLETDLAEARFQWEEAERQIELFRDRLIPKARESLDVALTAFSAGNVAYLDLIDAERALLENLLALERARTTRLRAAATWHYLTGKGVRP